MPKTAIIVNVKEITDIVAYGYNVMPGMTTAFIAPEGGYCAGGL